MSNPWAVASEPENETQSVTQQVQSEIASLDSLLFRFAATDDVKLERPINNVLPSLLTMLTKSVNQSNDQTVNKLFLERRQKVLTIIQHINQRIKIIPSLQLPVNELVEMFVDEQYFDQPNNQSNDQSNSQSPSSANSTAKPDTSMFFTFTLMFIERGFERLVNQSISQSANKTNNQSINQADRERAILTPHLLMHVSDRSINQQRTILAILMNSLPSINQMINPSINESISQLINQPIIQSIKQFLRNKNDREVVLSFFVDFLLYTGESINQSINQTAIERITNGGKQHLTFDSINQSKLSIIQFLTVLTLPPVDQSIKQSVNPTINQSIDQSIEEINDAEFDPESNQSLIDSIDCLLHAVVGSTIGSNDVINHSTNWLKSITQSITQSTNQSINQSIDQLNGWDSPQLIESIYALYLGTRESMQPVSQPINQSKNQPADPSNAPSVIQPVNQSIKLKLIQYLLKSPFSVSINQTIKQSIKVLFDCLFSPGTFRFRQAGLSFSAHLIINQSINQTIKMGQILINTHLKFISTINQSIDQSTNQSLQQSMAQALNQLNNQPVVKKLAPLTPSQIATLRGSAYQRIGLIASRFSKLYINQSNNQSTNQPVNQTMNQSVSQTVNQTNEQWVEQFNTGKKLFTSDLRLIKLFFNALINQSNDQSISQNNQSDEGVSEIVEGLGHLRTLWAIVINQSNNQSNNQTINQSLINELRSYLIELLWSNNQSSNQPTNQSVSQSTNQRVRLQALMCLNRIFDFSDSIARWQNIQSINQTTNQAIKDEAIRGLKPFSISQSINQSRMSEIERKAQMELRQKEDVINQSTDQSINQTVNPSTSPEPASVPVNQSTNQSTNQTNNQSDDVISYPNFPDFVMYVISELGLTESINQSINPSNEQSITQSLNQLMKQSVDVDPVVLIRLIDFAWECFEDTAKRTINQSVGQSLDQSDDESKDLSLDSLMTGDAPDPQKSINQQYADQLINQTINQTVNPLLVYERLLSLAIRSTSSEVQAAAAKRLFDLVQSVNQSNNESNIQTSYQTLDQPGERFVNIDWLIGCLIDRSIDCRYVLADVLELISNTINRTKIYQSINQSANILSTNRSVNQSINQSDQIHGSVLLLGALLAQVNKYGWNPEYRSIDQSAIPTNNQKIDQSINQTDWDAAIRRATNLLIARLDTRDQINQSINQSISQSVNAAVCISIVRIGQSGTLAIPIDIKQSSVDNNTEPSFDRLKLIDRLIDCTRGAERKTDRVTEHAVRALGAIVKGESINQTDNQSNSQLIVQSVMKGVLNLISLKHEEVHFAVGQALAHVIDALDQSNSQVKNQLSTQSNDILNGILVKLRRGSLLERAASAVWLLCLIKYSQSIKQSINQPDSENVVTDSANQSGTNLASPSINQSVNNRLYTALVGALTDSHAFTQECAAKSLSLLYNQSNNETKTKLLDYIVSSFSNQSVNQTINQLHDQSINTEEGGSSTYRELMTVAKDVGQPDLMFKFLDAAADSAVWQSKAGAAFSLKLINQSANNQSISQSINQRMESLIPKIYLYQYDPNPKIKSSMRSMWQSMIQSNNQANQTTSQTINQTINRHFKSILKYCLNSQTSRQYRLRLAACAALTDLISHRSFDELSINQSTDQSTSLSLDQPEHPFLQLWSNLFRCLDDVNADVRTAAASLGQALYQLTIRLASPALSSRKVVPATLQIIIPFLLENGINSQVKEINSLSMKTLLLLIKNGGSYLRPHLAVLIKALLESLSNSENSQLQYLQFHAQSMNITDEQLEVARLSMARNTPFMDALSSCQAALDTESLPAVLEVVNDLLTQGLGLPTLTACAKLLISISNHPVLGSSTALKENVSPLLSTLSNGLSDSSVSVRKAFGAALGYLARAAPRKRVRRIVDQLMQQALAETKALQSGAAINQLVRHAGDVHRNELAPVIVPVAWLFSHDQRSDVNKVWSSVLDELLPSRSSGVLSYQNEFVTFSLPLFEASSYSMRSMNYTALAKLIKLDGKDFSRHVDVIAPLLCSAIGGRIWQGKHKIFELATNLVLETTHKDEVTRSIFEGCLNECSRNRSEHRREAMKAAAMIANKFPDVVDAGQALEPAIERSIGRDDATFAAMEDEVLGTEQSTSQSINQPGDQSAAQSSKPAVKTSNKSAKPVKLTEDERKTAGDIQHANLLIGFECLGLSFPVNSSTSKSVASSAEQSSDQSGDASMSPPYFKAQSLASQQALLPWTCDCLIDGLQGGHAWDVRVVVLDAAKLIIEKLDNALFKQPNTSLSRMIRTIGEATADPKHSAVRGAAMKVLQSLVDKQSSKTPVTLPADHLAVLRSVVDARRHDTDATVLRLSEQIRGQLK